MYLMKGTLLLGIPCAAATGSGMTSVQIDMASHAKAGIQVKMRAGESATCDGRAGDCLHFPTLMTDQVDSAATARIPSDT